MISLKNTSSGGSREKVDFPVELAVDNVSLKSIEKNERVLGLEFTFQRLTDTTVSWLSSSLLPPKREWITSEKKVGDKTLTIEDQWNSQLNSWVGYIRHILIAAGIPSATLDNVEGETIEAFIDNLINKVTPLIDSKNLFYLKVIKNKAGYSSLPQYRGTGVAQSMDLGYPTKFAYSTYEQAILDEDVDGVVDSTTSATGIPVKTSGLDF